MTSRRDEIRGVATTLFAEQGYRGTSMRDIAEANGLLPGSLYAHFSSKAELVREIVGAFYDDLLPAQEAVLATEGTGADTLEAMIRAVQDVCRRHPAELTILHYDWKDLSTLEEFVRIRQMSFHTLDLWHKVVAAGIADGTVTPIGDAETVVRIITSSIHGVLDSVRYRDWQHGAVADDVIGALPALLLSGLATNHQEANDG